jgi:type IV pilus assembly protein PilW
MKPMNAHRNRSAHGAQLGFTLVELMVAMAIGLFLVGGLITLMGGMRRTYTTQTGLSQLQDNERVAMTLITDVLQAAGYFPLPTTNTAQTVFPATSPFTVQGQSIFGQPAVPASAGDTLTVRFLTNGTAATIDADNLINCTGNTSPTAITFVNTFSVDSLTGDLVCALNGGAPVHLVSGLVSMQVLYGVHTNTSLTDYSVDTYMSAAAVTAAADWLAVISVKVTLTFTNPTYGNLPGQSTTKVPQTVVFTRVIDVMNQTGVTT